MTIPDRCFTAVLFDIDGTLLANSSSHIQFLIDTVTAHTGASHEYELAAENPHIDGRNVSGFTDRQLLEHLVPGDDAHSRRWRERIMIDYPRRFADSVSRGMALTGDVIPGARTTLEVARRAGLALGLSTGNASTVARAKLAAADLDSDFLFTPDLGFGDRWAPREAVVRAAIVGLQGVRSPVTAAEEVDPLTIALVGDTVSDMRSAVAHGLTPIGVLTGAATSEQLRRAGARHVLHSVQDLPTML